MRELAKSYASCYVRWLNYGHRRWFPTGNGTFASHSATREDINESINAASSACIEGPGEMREQILEELERLGIDLDKKERPRRRPITQSPRQLTLPLEVSLRETLEELPLAERRELLEAFATLRGRR